MKVAESQTANPQIAKQLGLRTMQRFAFDRLPPSETSPTLYLKSGFFAASTQSVLSNSGILDVSRIRLYDEKLHSILKNVPYLAPELLSEQQKVVEEEWRISTIKPKDISSEFIHGNLSEEGMERFFAWWDDVTKDETLRASEQQKKDFFRKLRNAGRLKCEICGSIELKDIQWYTQLAHRKELLPPKTIYLSRAQNHANYFDFFGWKPLDPVDWLAYACKLNHTNPESRLTWDKVLDRYGERSVYGLMLRY